MSEPEGSSWQTAFVVTTLLVGDTQDEAKASLSMPNWAIALIGAPALQHSDKILRARAMAGVLAEIGAGLEELRLA